MFLPQDISNGLIIQWLKDTPATNKEVYCDLPISFTTTDYIASKCLRGYVTDGTNMVSYQTFAVSCGYMSKLHYHTATVSNKTYMFICIGY